MVHKPERLVDIIYQLRKNKIEPKEIRFVHPYEKKESTIPMRLMMPMMNPMILRKTQKAGT